MKRSSSLVLTALVLLAFTATTMAQLAPARDLLAKGRYHEALESLRSLAVESPKNAEIWALLGAAYNGVDRPDSALAAGKKALGIDDELPEAYVAIATAQIKKKALSDAYKTVYSGLRQKKNNATLLRQLGYVHLAADSVDKAIIAFTQAKEANPNNPLNFITLGDAYMKQNIPAMAALQYQKALEIDSLNAEYRFMLAKAYKADRQWTEAAIEYVRVSDLDATNSQAMLEAGTLYFRGKRYQLAAKYLGMFLAKEPNSPDAEIWYLEALNANKQYLEAYTVATRVLARDPENAVARRILALACFETERYAEAIVQYNAMIAKKDSVSVLDLRRLSRAYQQEKNDSLAAEALERVIVMDPKGTDIYNQLAAMYMKMKKYDKAAEVYDKLSIVDPGTGPLLQKAVALMQVERWEDATAALSAVVQKEPDNMKAFYYLAKVYSYQQKNDESVKNYQKVIELAVPAEKFKNELAEAHAVIGLSNLIEKRYPAAIEWLTKSLAYRDDIAQYRFWRAQAMALAGRKDDAVKEYRVVLKLDPKNKQAQKEMDSLQGKGN